MSIKISKINDEVVTPPKYIGGEEDKRPVKSENVFKEVFFNCFICAKKHSGKTYVINKIVSKVCTKDTTVLVFAGTLNKDKTHKAIKKYCHKNGIPYVGYDSLKQDGIDVLDVLIKKLQAEAKKEDDSDDDDNRNSYERNSLVLFESDDEEPPKKSKYRSPEYLIIIDDLSKELKSGTLIKLMKENRHYKCSIVCSSQHANDLLPEEIEQCDYILLFKGQPLKKLEKFYEDADLTLDFKIFDKIYDNATKEPYNFLYIDAKNEKFRRNFTHEYNIDQELLEPKTAGKPTGE